MSGTPRDHGFPVLAELGEDNAGDDEEQPPTENRECAAPDPRRRGGGVADEAGTAQAFGQPGPHDRPPEVHGRLFASGTVLDHGTELGTVTIPPAGGIPPEHGPADRVVFLMDVSGPHAGLPEILGTRPWATAWLAMASRRAPSSARRC